ncbi:hypothetical protein Hamer_G031937, partial [Homarus americanus]
SPAHHAVGPPSRRPTTPSAYHPVGIKYSEGCGRRHVRSIWSDFWPYFSGGMNNLVQLGENFLIQLQPWHHNLPT